jgi:hypothetical protein
MRGTTSIYKLNNRNFKFYSGLCLDYIVYGMARMEFLRRIIRLRHFICNSEIGLRWSAQSDKPNQDDTTKYIKRKDKYTKIPHGSYPGWLFFDQIAQTRTIEWETIDLYEETKRNQPRNSFWDATSSE